MIRASIRNGKSYTYRYQAKLVGGKLTIWTQLDSRTQIELRIQGSRAYAQTMRRFWNFGKGSATATDKKDHRA